MFIVPVLKILVPKLKLEFQPLQFFQPLKVQFCFNFKNLKIQHMIHSFLSLGSNNVQKNNENKTTGAKVHASVLGQNFPKPAIVLRQRRDYYCYQLYTTALTAVCVLQPLAFSKSKLGALVERERTRGMLASPNTQNAEIMSLKVMRCVLSQKEQFYNGNYKCFDFKSL